MTRSIRKLRRFQNAEGFSNHLQGLQLRRRQRSSQAADGAGIPAQQAGLNIQTAQVLRMQDSVFPNPQDLLQSLTDRYKNLQVLQACL